MKRIPIKRKPTHKDRQTPPEVYQGVCIRSGGEWIEGKCYGGHCEICNDKNRDWRGLQFSHYGKHRKMGGTTDPEVHSAQNIKRCCGPCHDEHDGR